MYKKQNGMVLIMTMVILVMVSGLGIFALKRSVIGEQIAKNMRSQAFAMQLAEGALRYCEDAIVSNKKTMAGRIFAFVPLQESMAGGGFPSTWKLRNAWVTSGGGQNANAIPASTLVILDGGTVPDPLCMVEEFALPVMTQDLTTTQPFLVTAIGYTADYRANTNGVVQSGSEIWLQSIVRP